MPVFSICIPSFNAAGIIGETIESVLAQTYGDFECLVVDDCSTDKTEEVVRGFHDPRIRFIRGERNLGYPGNFKRCRDLAEGTYVYYLGNDDILSPVALERTLQAFELADDIALVTRPYYWFEDDSKTAVRVVPPLDPHADRIVSVNDDLATFHAVVTSLGQISALAYRRSAFVGPFVDEVFTAHIYPFLAAWRTHRAVFLHDYVLAVRIASSQTRYLSSIYDPSPTLTWVRMFQTLFAAPRFARLRRAGVDHMAGHVEGLVQIRCYAPYGWFLREISTMIRYRPRNLITPKFWIFALGLAILPANAIIKLVTRIKPFISGARRRRHDIRLSTKGVNAAGS